MKHDLDINMSFSGSILSDDKCNLVAYIALPDYRYKLEYQINRSKELYNIDEHYLRKMADEISKEEYIYAEYFLVLLISLKKYHMKIYMIL